MGINLFCRAEPKKKKKVDPKREQAVRDRLKKRLKKLERVPPELIPIEDFITPTKFLDESRSVCSETLVVNRKCMLSPLFSFHCRIFIPNCG